MPEKTTDLRSSYPSLRPYPGSGSNAPTFTENLYKNMVESTAGTPSIMVASPLGVGLGLATLALGAAGSSRREILSVLGLTMVRISEQYPRVVKSLQKSSQVKVITKLFLDQSFFPVDSKFKSDTPEFGTQIEKVNFKKEYTSEVTRANRIVSDEVGKIIGDAIYKEEINEKTDLLLLNTLYFDGIWNTPFQKHMGFKGDFKISTDNTIQVQYMSQAENYYYYMEDKEGKFQMLELPYRSETDKPPQFSLIIILPDSLQSLGELQQLITKDHTWLTNYDIDSSGGKVLVKPTIPKFTIDKKLQFKDILNKMGINKVFEDTASMKYFSEKKFKLSTIQQRLYFTVDEKAVESDSGDVQDSSSNHDVKVFVADHPFVFALIERTTKTVLLLGHVLRPEYQQSL